MTKIFANAAHSVDSSDGIDSHTFTLMRLIVRAYLNIRKFHIVKCWNVDQKGVNVRQSLTKVVLCNYQNKNTLHYLSQCFDFSCKEEKSSSLSEIPRKRS